jgi:hypothetical protein
MASGTSTAADALRIEADDLKRRLAGGERATLLDVRGQSAWDSSNEKLPGAVRLSAAQFRVDPAWPPGQLTVAYCT